MAAIVLVEYGPQVTINDLYRDGWTSNSMHEKLAIVGARVARSLGIGSSPLEIGRGGLRARDFAGFMRIDRTSTLEVVPKFLNEFDEDWRLDFIYLAYRFKYGKFLTQEELGKILADRPVDGLLGYLLVNSFESLMHKPLRTYRSESYVSWDLDGEMEVEDWLLKEDPDGISQTRFIRSKNNSWNSEIAQAAQSILVTCVDIPLRKRLERMRAVLGPQTARSATSATPGGRNSDWRATLELARDINRGLGASVSESEGFSPGFVVSTWQLWENLVVEALKLAWGSKTVQRHQRFTIGHRRGSGDAVLQALKVIPDATIFTSEGLTIVADAKYKLQAPGLQRLRISNQDIYEGLAFARGARSTIVILLYPRDGSSAISQLGTCEVHEQIEVDGIRIFACSVEVRGISKRGGIDVFGTTLARVIGVLAGDKLSEPQPMITQS